MHNVAVFLPYLPADERRVSSTARSGGTRVQYGVTTEFDRGRGYSNNFWFISPSAVHSLLRTAGFGVDEWQPSPSGVSRHVFVATPTDLPAV
jgi:hypothetical protein